MAHVTRNGSPGRPAASDARILVVDDIEANRDLLVRRLRRDGYDDVETAEDGERALSLLAEHEFDLVLLDVMMPRCNGYEVLERMAGSRRLREVPVVMLSAQSEIESVVRCIELGAVDFLQKPFNPVLLRARVGATLEKKLLRDEARRHLHRLEQELDAGRKLQMAMVPTDFPAPTAEQPIEVHAMMEPAREVAGDLYDFFTADDGTFCFLVGDVSGKGVASALVMARTKTLVRTVAAMTRGNGDATRPGDILVRVNRELCAGNDDMMFVTLFFGMLDGRTGDLSFANAGHDAPFWLRAKGTERVVGERSIALGVLPEASYPSGHVVLEAGDAIYAFTDGITEATAPDGSMFTEARLAATLETARGAPLADLTRVVGNAVSAFIGDAPPSDDITALAVRRVG